VVVFLRFFCPAENTPSDEDSAFWAFYLLVIESFWSCQEEIFEKQRGLSISEFEGHEFEVKCAFMDTVYTYLKG
jgi:hypothetical protein